MAKKTAYLVAICLMLVALPILGACAPQQAGPAGKEPYKIGVSYPQTGPVSVQGNVLLGGIQVAVEDINKKGGVNGHPLQLVVEDSKGTPEGGVAAMRKLVQVDGVPVINTLLTNVVTAQIPVAQELKVPFISPAEAPGLPAKSQGWYFAHSTLLDQTLPALVKVLEQRKVKRLFVFLPDTSLGEIASPLWKEAAAKIGAAYEEARFKLGETDFRGLISRAKASNPDAISIYGHSSIEEPTIMKQIREMGINTPMYLAHGKMTEKNYREAAGSAVEGLVYAGYKYDKQAAKDMIEAYKAKFGFEPDYGALEAYDIVRITAEAIRKEGYSAAGIRKGLAAIKDFPSIGGGKITMDETGQSRVEVGAYEMKGGQIVEYK